MYPCTLLLAYGVLHAALLDAAPLGAERTALLELDNAEHDVFANLQLLLFRKLAVRRGAHAGIKVFNKARPSC